MFLDINTSDCQMKLVYELATELERDPEHVKLVQGLTLDANRPLLGLKGTHGLFGSPQWWANVRESFEERRGWFKRLMTSSIKTEVKSGLIVDTYFAGQDARWGDQVNTFDLKLEDGTILSEGIYPKLKSDRKLFVRGAKVSIAYVLDELKRRDANGRPQYSNIVLEMAVSTKPVRHELQG